MKYKRALHYITATVIVFSILFSGCVSAPPQTTSTPTPVPTASPIVPAINVTSYPASVDEDTDFVIDWQVSGGAPGYINKTAIIWGFNEGSANTSDYSNMSAVQTGNTPMQFNATLKVSDNGTIYFRAYAIVDGAAVYSKEYQTIIVPSTVSGEY